MSGPPRPPSPRPAPTQALRPASTPLGISRGLQSAAHKIVIYGSGGIGKTKLASLLPQAGIEPLFIDLEAGTKFLDVARVNAETWDELRATLHNTAMLAPFGAVVVDSGTKAEELASAWVIANIEHEKGRAFKEIKSIEDFGFGKGLTHIYETFMFLLGDLDAIARSGKHVIIVCHDCISNVPNPQGDDFLRYEARLQSPASGKFSIRHRIKEWCDHMLFVGYDVASNKDGKAKGGGTRAIYTSERPTHLAKSRTLDEVVVYVDNDATIWTKLHLNNEGI
jgi:hypothetical protein